MGGDPACGRLLAATMWIAVQLSIRQNTLSHGCPGRLECQLEKLRSIKYVSRSQLDGDLGEVASLVSQCRENNQALSVTGVLYHDGFVFFQVLEGPKAVLERLMQRICHDQRHADVHLLSDLSIQHRFFQKWHMKLVSGDLSPRVATDLTYSSLCNASNRELQELEIELRVA